MNATDEPLPTDLDFETRARLEQHLDAVEDVLRSYQQPRNARSAIVDELENQICESLDEQVSGRLPTLNDLNALLAEMDPPEAYARNSIDLPPESISANFSFPSEAVESRFNKATFIGLMWWVWLAFAAIMLLFLSTIEVTAKADYRASPRDPLWTSIPAIRTGWGITLTIIFGLPGILAPLVSSILGWLGVTQIRHSLGRQHGLGLAFSQAALLPIAAISSAIGGIIITPISIGIAAMFEKHRQQGSLDTELEFIGMAWISGAIFVTAVVSLIVNLYIVRRMWRHINRPIAAAV